MSVVGRTLPAQLDTVEYLALISTALCDECLWKYANIAPIYNRCIGDDTKTAARQSLNCSKNNKIWRKTIFNMADGILTPAMWHDRDIDFAR